MGLDYKTLKHRHKEIRGGQPEATRLRIHRALSWLKAAEAADDSDTRFIFLWITFNSIYAQDDGHGDTFGEKGRFNRFLGQLVRLDAENLIHKIAWDNYSGKIRLFIDNPYCSRYFWDFHNGRLSEEKWKQKFEQSRRDAQRALATKDTTIFCTILFDRLYVLRNQLMHGGATWKSDVNRAQVTDGARILEQMIPAMIYIMMENAEEDWGHQHERVNDPPVSFGHLRESIKKPLPVFGILKDCLLMIPTTHHMVRSPFKFNSWFSCHGIESNKK